jgi:ABC-2 type transport system ATP-binding protein
MSIEVRQLSKLYGSTIAVNNISFTVGKGEIVGFIGPNGAGKSTTMKIITGSIINYTGNASICGHNIRTGQQQAKQRIGYLPEHNPLYLEMYIKEYLLFSARMYGADAPWQRIDKMIGALGLDGHKSKKLGQLSKGYRQRAGLAAALLHQPEVLVLDEPTTGLDPNQIIEIRNLIAEAGRDKAVILSTHIMQEVEAICDRIIIIDKGNILADGSSESVKRDKKSQGSIIIELEAEASIQSLMDISGVTAAEAAPGNKYVLELAEGADARKDIFLWAAETGNALLGMQRQEKSLEQAFRELTGSI